MIKSLLEEPVILADDGRNTLILVPTANPHSAPERLALAHSLLGNHAGRIVMLYVSPEHAVTDVNKLTQFREIVDSASTDQTTVEFMKVRADKVADGILGVTQDMGADFILMGLRSAVRGEVELGPIVTEVAQAAPCDVLIYRGAGHQEFQRVVVPVGGSRASRVILQIGQQLSRSISVPMDALHIYNDRSQREAHEHVDELLQSLDKTDDIDTHIIHGTSPAQHVISMTDAHDLLVIGYSDRTKLEKWLFGDTAQSMLDRARGSVLMVARAANKEAAKHSADYRLSWIRPLLTQPDQEQVIWSAKDTALPTLDYFVLLTVAVVLASLGLLLNSAAVVIGAMLVAPLMQPIIALGVGLCTARLGMMRKASVTILLSVLAALGLSTLIGLLMPPIEPTQEMLGRAYPSLLDAGVALASGFIGAYATARKDIPAALAGVAIAAALVPPLCTVGLSIAIGEMRLALGSGLLFATNVLCIMIVGALVFLWMGIRPVQMTDLHRRRRYAFIIGSLLAITLALGAMLNQTRLPSVERISESNLASIFAPAQVVNLEIQEHEPLIVVATLRSTTGTTPETVKLAQVAISDDLNQPILLRVVTHTYQDSDLIVGPQ